MRKSRSSDDVFFFTLIDFLLQVFFFGLVLFVVVQAVQTAKKQEEEAQIKRLMETAGVSSLTELTDLLTKLVPLDELKGTKEFFARYGGMQKVKDAMAAVAAAGGPEKVAGMGKDLESARKQLEAAWGKPSCLPNVFVNGKEQPKAIAKAVVDDSRITLQDVTPEMKTVLAQLNLDYAQVQTLDLASFRRTFAPLIARQPNCRYFVARVTNTKLLEPVNALWSAFRTTN